jgi:hypothetical protein
MQTTEHMRIVKTIQSCTCRIFPKLSSCGLLGCDNGRSIRWTLTIRKNVFSPTSRQTLITRREAIYSAYNVTLRRVQQIVAVKKAISIPHFCECVHVDAYVCVCVCARARAARVALLIQDATRMRHIIIYSLWLHHIFRHYLINGLIFGKTLSNKKLFVLIFLYQCYLKHFSFQEQFSEILS